MTHGNTVHTIGQTEMSAMRKETPDLSHNVVSESIAKRVKRMKDKGTGKTRTVSCETSGKRPTVNLG